MKFFTNKGVVQKTVISMVIIILTTFCIPMPVQADVGGKLMNPIINFVVSLFDGVQHLLEWAMLGRTENFMSETANKYIGNSEIVGPEIPTDEKIDSKWFGLDAVNIPRITYTPEEIFSNKVPALDINFINPSVKTGDDATDQKMNVAIKLRPIIASWYVAIRTIAIVGLLSVLVYLGIRMLLTSVAADKAKYKQMMMDWVVAICLVFALHYIMSFALTMAETVTAMLSSQANATFTVYAKKVSGGIKFPSNLMGYVRFMVQAEDLHTKLAFVALYIMLVIYSVRFTWIYLKRVVNMAFLTLIAPLVALTYPLDKVSDGKAQAFDMWIKEYSYNALIQPVHLLLYTVLLGTAVELAANNPLYGIVALGFIISAEKLVKKMFGFDKASGGTLGSLAGAAGVTAMAGKAMNALASGKGGKSGNGKVRTNDNPQREGKDAGANKPFDAFADKSPDETIGAGGNEQGLGEKEDSLPVPPEGNTPEEEEELAGLRDELDNTDYNDAYMNPEEYQAKLDRISELEGAQNGGDDDGIIPPEDEETQENQDPSLWDVMRTDTANFRNRLAQRGSDLRDSIGTTEGRQKILSDVKKGAKRRAIGAWKALPTVGYKAARGTLRTASRVALAGAMGGLGLAIGATTGDGEKAMSMAMGAAGVGLTTGDNLFDAAFGNVMPDRSIRDAYGAGKYGNKIDARNARADKAYERSEKFDDFYEKKFKGKDMLGKQLSKKEFAEIVQSYRKAGITSEKDIETALKLENKYYKDKDGLSEENRREQVQNVVQLWNNMDSDAKRAFHGDEKAKKALHDDILAGVKNEKTANNIFTALDDYRKER